MPLILVFKFLGVMDRSNNMQRVRRSLQEGEEMVSKQKADRHDLDLDIQLERV